MERPLIIGRGGAPGCGHANTLRSIERAMRLGVDAVLLDVQVCLSGEPVLCSDRHLKPKAGLRAYLCDRTLAELQGVDLRDGEGIPTLASALDLLKPAGGEGEVRPVRVHLNLLDRGTAVPVARLLDRHVTGRGWRRHEFLVSSALWAEVQQVRYIDGELPLAVAMQTECADFSVIRARLRPMGVYVDERVCTLRLVRSLHERGLAVFVETVNDLACMERWARAGVEGIASDFPERLSLVLAESSAGGVLST